MPFHEDEQHRNGMIKREDCLSPPQADEFIRAQNGAHPSGQLKLFKLCCRKVGRSARAFRAVPLTGINSGNPPKADKPSHRRINSRLPFFWSVFFGSKENEHIKRRV